MGRRRKIEKAPRAQSAWLAADGAARPLRLPAFADCLPPGAARAPQHKPLEARARTLVEDAQGPAVVAAEGALTAAECRAWIAPSGAATYFASTPVVNASSSIPRRASIGLPDAYTQHTRASSRARAQAWGEREGFAREAHAATAGTAFRDNSRLAVESAEVAAGLFRRLLPLIPALGGRPPAACSPNVRLYKYGPGQRFGRHVDGANVLADGAVTEFTVLLYLNDEGVRGGETVFYEDHGPTAPRLAAFAPRAGAVLLHAHGDRCLTHEGAEVLGGTKYLLRTDVAFAPP